MEGPRAPISAGLDGEAGRREERAKEADLAERRSTDDDKRKKELQEWREQETVHQWMQKARDLQDSDAYTVADICSGGLLASIASTRAGLKHTFTSEIDPAMKEMAEQSLGVPNIGDMMNLDLDQRPRLHVLTAGTPCERYSQGGDQSGFNSDTGKLYVELSNKIRDTIEENQPEILVLEQVPNVKRVHDGAEYEYVTKMLSENYVLHERELAAWRFGDPTARVRLFTIGIHKRNGVKADTFTFPEGSFDENNYPKARDIAIPDYEVAPQYLLNHDVAIETEHRESVPGETLIVADQAPGMGPSSNPNKTHSWDEVAPTQTTHNGNGAMPMLNWVPGEAIHVRRRKTPVETVAMASLMPDYLDFARVFDKSDEHVWRCVNQGWPLRMGTAIMETVREKLESMQLEQPKPKKYEAHGAFMVENNSIVHEELIQSILVDTGATGIFINKQNEKFMSYITESLVEIECADRGVLRGEFDGDLEVLAINTANGDLIPFDIEAVTSVEGLSKELLGVDPLYRNQGYGLHIPPRHTEEEAYLYRLETDQWSAVQIPLRWDKEVGGWWLDYIPKSVAESHTMAEIDAYRERKYADMADAQHMSQDELWTEYTKADYEEAWQRPEITEIITTQHPDDRVFRAVKSGLKRKKDKLTAKEFHEMYGHLGHDPTCDICRMVKGNMRRITKVIDPYRETRPGHTWVMDTITFNKRSDQGNKFLVVLKDIASSAYMLFPMYSRKHPEIEVAKFIDKLRQSPEYHDLPYKPVSVIKTDDAGEWGILTEAWHKTMSDRGVESIYSSPDRKEEASYAERACGIVEVVIKSLLMQQNLPPSWWQYAADQASFLLNRFPVQSQDGAMPVDGDLMRPLQILTRGRYSARQIDRELSYFIPIGTPALVHDPDAKGSTLGPKCRWGVAVGMMRETPLFINPFTRGSRPFRSKSFTAFKLKEGLNYAQLLGLPEIPSTRRSLDIVGDWHENLVVTLPPVEERESTRASGIHSVVRATEDDVTVDRDPLQAGGVITSQLESENGVSVRIQDPQGREFITDPFDGRVEAISGQSIEPASPQNETQNDENSPQVEGVQSNELRTSITSTETGFHELEDSLIEISLEDDDVVAEAEAENLVIDGSTPKQRRNIKPISSTIETRAMKMPDNGKGITASHEAGGIITWNMLCKHFGFRNPKIEEAYYQWLIRAGFPDESIPRTRGSRLEEGKYYPKPSGEVWGQMRGEALKGHKLITPGSRDNRSSDDKIQKIAESCLLKCYLLERLEGNLSHEGASQPTHSDLLAMAASRTGKPKAKRRKAVSTGTEPPPKSVEEALNHDTRAIQWLESILDEWLGLEEMGVLSHGYTLAEVRAMGVSTDPVPLTVVLDHKFDSDGVLDRLKARICLRGTPRYMQKGVHFDETFASTPNANTMRILMALMCHENLHQLCYDIKMAYCWAELEDGDRICVKYPKGFERYAANGDELFMILEKNLYGAPNAARNWGICRDTFIQEHFNKNGWTCVKSKEDPCLFYITRQSHGKIERAWLLIHTDDVDSVGDNPEILEDIYLAIHKKWKCKKVDSDFMLGIKRTVDLDAEDAENSIRTVDSVTLTMEVFVRGMADTFREHLPLGGAHKNLPCPPGTLLTVNHDAPEEEIKHVMNLGYQRAVGCLLWAARGVFPQCLYSVNQLSKLMGKPTMEAFKIAMHTIAWMEKNATTGIKFSRSGNRQPVSFSDATNEPDPKDMRRHYGYTIQWMGGPVVTSSKKVNHATAAVAANEFMAISHCTQRTYWLRKLLAGIGMSDVIKEPTIIAADNRAANSWCNDGKVTDGNCYIRTDYYLARECVQDGYTEIRFIPSIWNLSDIMTKAVSTEVMYGTSTTCKKPREGLNDYLCGYKYPAGGYVKWMESQLK